MMRAHLPQSVAVERLRAGAGTQFDPAIVGLFLEYLDTHGGTHGDAAADLAFLEELFPDADDGRVPRAPAGDRLLRVAALDDRD